MQVITCSIAPEAEVNVTQHDPAVQKGRQQEEQAASCQEQNESKRHSYRNGKPVQGQARHSNDTMYVT